jgi:hypothetical protein
VEQDPISENQCESVAKKRHPNWGGPRPGSGAPRGNTNALKHGKYSRRQADLLQALLDVPQAKEAFIALAKRNKQRRKEAEEGAGILMTALLEKVAVITLNHQNDHGPNNQEFLDFLNLATAQMRTLLRKQPRQRLRSTKPKADG